MNACYKGWPAEEGNKSGRCCCNCANRVPIRSHPSNTMVGGRLKGPVSHIVAFGCKMLRDGTIIFMQDEHSICEEHSWDLETQKDKNGQEAKSL